MLVKYLQDVADRKKGEVVEEDTDIAKFRVARGYCERTNEAPEVATEKPKNKTVKKSRVRRKAK